MTTHIKAIVFDFGNVLIRWDPYNLFLKYFSDVQAIDRFMAEVNFYDWNLRLDRGAPFSQVFAEFSAKHPQHACLFRAYFNEEWEASILGVIPETVKILHQLKAAGQPLYGLTNWSAEKFALVRQEYEFCKLFNDIVVSGEVKITKPDPAIFHLLLQRIGRPAQECLFIDDSLRNVEAARNLGFVAVHFTSPARLEAELLRLGIL